MPAAGAAEGRFQDLPVFGRVVYSQCWEDPRSARAALRLTPEDDLLTITSGGCNALALSLDAPRSITALDFNATQNHLLELKMASIRAFEYGDYLRFLGVRPSRRRVERYEVARAHLSRAARDFWDAHGALIERGVIHVGRFERYLRIFRRFVLPLTHSRREIGQLLSLESVGEQRRFYDRVWNNRRWRALLRVFFGRLLQGRLGRHPAFLRYSDVSDVGAHYLNRARYAVTDLPLRDNYFVEYVLTGTYASQARMPPYLQRANFETLRAGMNRIEVVTGSATEYLDQSDAGRFSAYHLSDILEWMGEAEVATLYDALLRSARPGSGVCYYNNLAERSRPAGLSDRIAPDEALACEVSRRDRAFMYRRFQIERIAS